MHQGVVQWSRPFNTQIGLSLLYKSPTVRLKPPAGMVLMLNSLVEKEDEALSARDRRRLRNERRQSGDGINWRETVEERLIQKPKKRYASWTEELNLDNLALLGPQWWAVRVSRVSGQETANLLARLLARSYPGIEFKLYNPSVEEKRKLKNGSYSVKARPIFPGCVFLHCVLNKEVHDFIREINGVGGFIGSKVGNTKKQINLPRAVSQDDMEAMFIEAKEEQLRADQAFMEMERASNLANNDDLETTKELNPERKLRPIPVPSVSRKGKRKLPTPGSTVKVVSGAFADFPGVLRKLDRKNGKASVGFTLLGKETIAEVDIEQIEIEGESFYHIIYQ